MMSQRHVVVEVSQWVVLTSLCNPETVPDMVALGLKLAQPYMVEMSRDRGSVDFVVKVRVVEVQGPR